MILQKSVQQYERRNKAFPETCAPRCVSSRAQGGDCEIGGGPKQQFG